MSDIVVQPGEVLLYNQRYPLWGQVTRTAVTPFPPKVTFGDYTRDNEIIKSTWVLSEFSGGLGVLNMTLPRDDDRFWFSTLETRYRHLTLGPQVVEASETGPADVLVEFNEKLFMTVGTAVYVWSEQQHSLGSSVHTLSGTCIATAVYDGVLWFLTESGMHGWNGASWVDYTGSMTNYKPGGYGLVVYDNKLFRLGRDNVMYFTINPSDTEADWDTGGRLQLPPGYCQQLIMYFDLASDPAIHAITRVGVYVYDFASAVFHQTPVTYPVDHKSGKGAAVFRGELFVPVGEAIYAYNGTTIRNVSPAKDEGLPTVVQGDVVQVVAGHGFYYAVLEASPVSVGDPFLPFDIFQTGNPLDPDPMTTSATTGAVLASPEASWHSLFSQEVGSKMGAALVASIEGTRRIWISTDTGLFYIDISTELHNPLINPTKQFKRTGYLETGWTDLGWSEMDKLALSLDVQALNVSNTELIRFFVDWDNRGSWELVGEVTSSGRTLLPLGPRAGTLFRKARFRIEMERGDSASRSPVLLSAVMKFLRRPEMVWGWEVTLQLTDHHSGKSVSELAQELERAAVNKLAGEFTYRTGGTLEPLKHLVVISNMQGAESTGIEHYGRYQVSLIDLEEM